MANVSKVHEPFTYYQAKINPVCVEAMQKKLDALESNHIWDLTQLLAGHWAISSKSVYSFKYKPYGNVDRTKARLVIHGFDQKFGTDYKHMFSSVAKLATVRVFIVLATTHSWPFVSY